MHVGLGCAQGPGIAPACACVIDGMSDVLLRGMPAGAEAVPCCQYVGSGLMRAGSGPSSWMLLGRHMDKWRLDALQ